jgi:hypothetical protein
MKRPSYKQALEWMALNDDVYWLPDDPISVTGALTCDLFGVDDAKLRGDLLKAIKRVNPSHPVVQNEEVK